jgi:hypothetical protein
MALAHIPIDTICICSVAHILQFHYKRFILQGVKKNLSLHLLPAFVMLSNEIHATLQFALHLQRSIMMQKVECVQRATLHVVQYQVSSWH